MLGSNLLRTWASVHFDLGLQRALLRAPGVAAEVEHSDLVPSCPMSMKHYGSEPTVPGATPTQAIAPAFPFGTSLAMQTAI